MPGSTKGVVPEADHMMLYVLYDIVQLSIPRVCKKPFCVMKCTCKGLNSKNMDLGEFKGLYLVLLFLLGLYFIVEAESCPKIALLKPFKRAG